MTRVPMAILFVLAVAAVPAPAQPPAPVALHLGPLPNPDGAATPVPEDFAHSYADLRKAHARAGPADVALVDDATQADAILTVTFRGEVDAGTTIGYAAHGIAPVLNAVQHTMRTLRARLTVRTTGEGVDLAGVGPGDGDRTKWSTQAARIYAQAVKWLETNRERLRRR